MKKAGLVRAVLWTWVIVIFAAYLYQFRDIAGSVVQALVTGQ